MRSRARLVLLTALSIGLALGCAGTRQTREEPVESGFLSDYSKLQPGGKDRVQLVYLEPGLDVSRYRAVRIEPVKLYATAPDSDLAKLSRKDQQMLADRLQTAIVDALRKDWPIASRAGPDVLVVRGALSRGPQPAPRAVTRGNASLLSARPTPPGRSRPPPARSASRPGR